MVKHFLNRRMIFSIGMMLVVCLGTASCESLRKKFTRHKKQDQVQSIEFQPILEPQEYPTPESNPEFNYKQHYALVKAWYKDLWVGIDEQNSDSSVKYGIKQILDHLEQMKLLLKPEKSSGVNKVEDLLKFYLSSLDQVRIQRNYARIRSDLLAFDRILRNQFRVDVVKKDFVSR